MKQYIIACIAIVVLASCDNNDKPVAENAATSDTTQTSETVAFSAQQLKSVGIEVGTPTVENISGVLILQGTVDVPPQNIVSLSFPLGGYLRSTKILPGMHVKKGQELAVIEDMQFIQLQQDYLTAKEKFQLAETEYNRQKELNEGKATSDKIYQQTKTTMETERILMHALARKLEMIGINPATLNAANISKSVSISSPIDGYVAKVNVNAGKYTAPTDRLFELVDPGDIHLALNVFEKDLGKIAIGQKVLAYTNDSPYKKVEAEIILMGKILNEDRMAEIHCHLKKHDPALVPGMFINAEVAVTNVKGLTVPEQAVVRWENKYYVFTDSGNGQFEMVEVKPGVLSNGRQQIEGAGITQETKLVVKNAYALLMKIKNTEEA